MALDDSNPFDKIGDESELRAPSAGAPAAPPSAAAPEQPAPAAASSAPTGEANPFDAIGPAEVQAPPSAFAAGLHEAERNVLPTIAAGGSFGPGAAGGAAVGAFGGPLAPITVPAGALVGGLLTSLSAGYATSKAQDYAVSKLPDSWREAVGQDDTTREAEARQHPTAVMLGGFLPMTLMASPGGFARAAGLAENSTAIQRLMANPVTARLFGGTLMGGMELGQEKAEGAPVDWRRVATATAFGTVFNKPTRIGEAIESWGERLGRNVTPETAPAVNAGADQAPTLAQAGDMKVMGPGITEDVHRGDHEQDPQSAMTAQDAARTETSLIGPPAPGPDLHEIARRVDPETFSRYDELSAQRDTFRKTIADAVNPPDDVMAEATAKRDAIQADLDKIPASGAGSDKAELRRLRAQVRDAQRGVDALQARRDAFAAGTAADTPEAAAARQHLMAIDYEMRDLSPAVSAAYRRAADHAASDTLDAVPLPVEQPTATPAGNAMVQMLADRGSAEAAAAPAQSGDQVAPAPRADDPTPVAPSAAAQAEPAPGLDIAADIARQMIAAGRPETEARAAGKIAEAYYRTKAARFKGVLGSAEDVYRATAPQMVGPDGRRIPGPPPRPADPTVAPRAPEPVSPTPAAAASPVAEPRSARAPRKNASLLEFLAQSGGIKPSGETKALFDRKSPFLPGLGPLVRKTGMGLDEALRAAEDAGYLHDPGAEAGAGPRTLGPNDLLDAIAREHGGTKIYRPGDEPPARRQTSAEQRDAVERHVVEELQSVGVDAADLDRPTLDALVGRVQSDQTRDPVDAYERVTMEQSEQHDYVREQRHAETGDIPGWDIPADAGATPAASGPVASRAGASAEGNGRSGEAGSASRAAGDSDREAHERWLDSVADTLFQRREDKANGWMTFHPGQRPDLRFTATANASTFIHESGHQFLEEMMQDAAHPAAPDDLRTDAKTVRDWLGNDGGRIKTSQHERFATGFEQYLREGRAPSPELASVFAQFRNWLVGLYQTLKGLGKEIPEDVRGVFDRLLATEPQRTVIAPEREGGPDLGDIHQADAAETEPHEADGGADRIEAEAARAVAESHPEIAREIEAADARAAAAREAEQQGSTDRAGAEPAGQTDGQPGEPGPLVGNRSGSDTQPGGGGAGASAASERSGGGEAAAESDGLRGSERTGSAARGDDGAGSGTAAERSADFGKPLAPGPATRFGPEQSRFVDRAGNIRLDTLTTSDDVRQAIRDAAAENQDFIGDRGGRVTDGQVMDLAEAAGLPGAMEIVAKRVQGQAFNAVEVMTLRKALVQSAQGLSGAARAAKDGDPQALLAFAEAKARHQLLQGTVAQATAEAGRALRAFRDISMSGEAKSADLFAREATGRTLLQLKREADLMATMDTPEKLSKFTADTNRASAGRLLMEMYVNGLISGPVTHVTYAIGNTILTANRMLVELPTAAAVGALRRGLGGEGGVQLGEVGAQLRGAAGGLAPAIQSLLDAYRTGATTLLPGEGGPAFLPFAGRDFTPAATLDEHANLFSIMQGLKDGVLAAGGIAKASASDLVTGARGGPFVSLQRDPAAGYWPNVAVRGVTVLPVGDVIRFPGRNVAAIHSFFRAMNYSIDKAGIAYRTAANEGLTGEQLAARVADIHSNPTDAVMEQARSTATNLTLMGQGGEFVKRLSTLLNWTPEVPGIGPVQPLRFIDPFVKISGNVMGQALMERTPIGAVFSSEIRASLAGKNGPAAQDLAMGRMIAGTALATTFGLLAKQGLVTGSGPQGKDEQETRHLQAMWKLAGNQAHSVRIGDLWYDVHRLGPLGMLMGVAADLSEIGSYASDGDLGKAGGAVMHAFTQNILDESFVKGPADLIEAVQDPARYGPSYIRNQLAGFVPYSTALAQMARAGDPYSREARSIVDTIKAKIPGLSESLFPKRDVWGMPIAARDALGGPYATAIYQQRANADPIAQAMLDIGVYPAPVERKIRGVDLSDAQHDDFARIAGGLLHDRMRMMVRMPDWSNLPGHVRHDIVEAQVKTTREVASNMVMMKYPSIPAAAVVAKRAKVMGTN